MTDRTQRMAVAAIALVTLACVIGIIILGAMDDTIPDSLVAIGSAGAGALAAIFTSRSASGQPAIPPSSPPPPPDLSFLQTPEWAEFIRRAEEASRQQQATRSQSLPYDYPPGA